MSANASASPASNASKTAVNRRLATESATIISTVSTFESDTLGSSSAKTERNVPTSERGSLEA